MASTQLILARGGRCCKRRFRRLSVNTISWDLARRLNCWSVPTLKSSSNLIIGSEGVVIAEIKGGWCGGRERVEKTSDKITVFFTSVWTKMLSQRNNVVSIISCNLDSVFVYYNN